MSAIAVTGTNPVGPVIAGVTLISEFDSYLFKGGKHFRLYEKLGSHPLTHEGTAGTFFAVWAPEAQWVSVLGDFNAWDADSHHLFLRPDGSGIWEGFVPGVKNGDLYKYHVHSKYDMYSADKGDPFAYAWENPPNTSTRVWEIDYTWNDSEWMKHRAKNNGLDQPISIYEMHLGSWRRVPAENNRFLTYRELAHELADYLCGVGYTHVEFLPVMEHPYYPSWGYQSIGYFAPTTRYGTPQDFMYLVDYLHQRGIGVIVDWVPSHFPSDEHGLGYFDGTHLFEHADPRQGFHPDWKSLIFNYGRHEVRGFLISSALFWLDRYHIDCLRVDAVASMLYLDYSRKDGEWIANPEGGRENVEAVAFLKQFNEEVYRNYPDVQTIAEESTSWPMVSRPTYAGGLGFGFKWNMGWMHDTLAYFTRDPVFRTYHHDQLTFSMLYSFTENFVLSYSHDEVVHMKGSMLNKMPGDTWQKFANLRLLLGYQFAHPGKKLMFMGTEFGQWSEWHFEHSLDWHVLEQSPHQGLLQYVTDLNRIYKSEKALHERDFDWWGFEWISCTDRNQSVLVFQRRGNAHDDIILAICNFTPVLRSHYRVGVPRGGFWKELLNSDSTEYGGSGMGNLGGLDAYEEPWQQFGHSLVMTLPPLSIILLKPLNERPKQLTHNK